MLDLGDLLKDFGWEIAVAVLAALLGWVRQRGRKYAKAVRLLTDAIEVVGNHPTLDGAKELKKLIQRESVKRKVDAIVAESAKRSETKLKETRE